MILTEYNENKILAQERQEGRQEGIQEGQMNAFTAVAERLIDNGTDGPTISIATGFDRLRIDDIAKKLQRTVSWGTDTRTAQTIQTAQAQVTGHTPPRSIFGLSPLISYRDFKTRFPRGTQDATPRRSVHYLDSRQSLLLQNRVLAR